MDAQNDADTLTSIENVIGSAYADTLTGDTNDNVLEGGAGADSLSGGAGSDTASYEGDGAGVTVNLSTGSATDGNGDTDTLTGIENVIGSAFNDTLTGTTGDNTLSGGNGNFDVLIGEPVTTFWTAAQEPRTKRTIPKPLPQLPPTSLLVPPQTVMVVQTP